VLHTAKVFRSAALMQVALLPLVLPGDIFTARRAGLVLVLGGAALGWFILRGLSGDGAVRIATVGWTHDLSLAAVLVAGVTLRLRALLAGRSLWLDEVSLAVGVRDLSFVELLSERLPHVQSAPPGFLLAARLGLVTAGSGPLAIRIVPFISGVLLLALTLIVARAAFSKRSTQLLFLLLISVSPTLVYYSTEFKQYASDAVLVLAALYVALVGRRPDNPRLVPVLGFVAAFASVPGALAFASLGSAILLHSYLSSGFSDLVRTFKDWLMTFLAWGLGSALHLGYTIVSGTDREFMVQWWSVRGGFPPERIGTLEQLSWYFERAIELVWMLSQPSGPIFPGTKSVSAVLFGAAALLVVLALRQSPFRASLPETFLGLFVLAAWLMAELTLYPLSSRLMIYSLPLVGFVLARGFDSGMAGRGLVRPLSAVAAAVVLLSAADSSSQRLLSPNLDRDMQAIVRLLEAEFREGDVIVLDSRSERILKWHDSQARIPSDAVFRADHRTVSEANSFVPVEERQPERVWVVATHRQDEAVEIADIIAERYPFMATFNRSGTLVVLMSRSDVSFVPTGDRRLVEVVEDPFELIRLRG